MACSPQHRSPPWAQGTKLGSLGNEIKKIKELVLFIEDLNKVAGNGRATFLRSPTTSSRKS